jgi:hypothetical protein
MLFERDSGWSEFHNSAKALWEKPECRFVLTADISDYYNQISHHRVQGTLAQAGVDENRSLVIERFLGNVNAGHHSRGIPVGPAVSILLAEACLSDVDNFVGRGYRHTRYVDDFRVFCDSSEEALKALHDLSDYLYTAHRLSLQAGKTRILSKDEFRKEELFDPATQESQAKKQRVEEALEFLRDLGYPEASDLINEGEASVFSAGSRSICSSKSWIAALSGDSAGRVRKYRQIRPCASGSYAVFTESCAFAALLKHWSRVGVVNCLVGLSVNSVRPILGSYLDSVGAWIGVF